MAKKYRIYVYAVKWDGKNIAEVEEVVGKNHQNQPNWVWSGDSTNGILMQVLVNDGWQPLVEGCYVVRSMDGKLSIVPADEFEATAKYTGYANIDEDKKSRERTALRRAAPKKSIFQKMEAAEGLDEEDEDEEDDK